MDMMRTGAAGTTLRWRPNGEPEETGYGFQATTVIDILNPPAAHKWPAARTG